jgi:chromate transporter
LTTKVVCILKLRRHIPFLRAVLLHSLTAFGGPQAHYGMMQRTFVKERGDITDGDLLDFNAFCNILPGASSTQVLTLVGFKRGGVPLATLTLIIWLLPACVLMGLLSFIVGMVNFDANKSSIFLFVQPMAIGFLLHAAYEGYRSIQKNVIVYVLIVYTAVAIFLFFRLPWMFPLVIVLAGVVTSLSKKRIPQVEVLTKKIKWSNLWLFAVVLIVSGFFSELSRRKNWDASVRAPLNLFENTYRLGSFVFGGGQVLIPAMESQFSERLERKVVEDRNPKALKITKEDFYTGAGIVRAIPGPVFSIGAFTGGMALRPQGLGYQILGVCIGSIAIFLPSAFLVLFFYPIWYNLKKFSAVYRALEGINAAVVGIMIGSTLYMLKSITFFQTNTITVLNFTTVFSTFFLLHFTKIPAPIVVLMCLLLGVVNNYFF